MGRERYLPPAIEQTVAPKTEPLAVKREQASAKKYERWSLMQVAHEAMEPAVPEPAIVEIELQEFEQKLAEQFEVGKQQGIDEGRLQAQAEQPQVIAQILTQLTKLESEYETLLAGVYEDALTVAFGVLTSILELRDDLRMESLRQALNESLRELEQEQAVYLYIAAEDREVVEASLDIKQQTKCLIREDATLKSGDLVIRSSRGTRTHSISEKLERVRSLINVSQPSAVTIPEVQDETPAD